MHTRSKLSHRAKCQIFFSYIPILKKFQNNPSIGKRRDNEKPAVAIGAARVASIRVGRIKLIEHESITGLKPGGHTISKHVGEDKRRTDCQTQKR
ncbi:hypothetical protein DDT56_10140 [Brenneria corticis]|uniref:Uncharacterized protein n=1 Tax=Brenneria corticis TaxID=2173106 RepID=A0A2U1U4B6_9GAMM|nr:hypothetical protein DDT56_10140 [Brenneria sp. CFCC 11842]